MKIIRKRLTKMRFVWEISDPFCPLRIHGIGQSVVLTKREARSLKKFLKENVK